METNSRFCRAAAIVLTVGFIYGSLVPLTFGLPSIEQRIAEMLGARQWLTGQPFDTAVNFLVFVPVGFLWSGACCSAFSGSTVRRHLRIHDVSKEMDADARSGSVFREAVYVLSGCFVVALTAEGLQFFVPMRTPSLRDVLTLEAGAALGCLVWWGASRRISSVLKALQRFASATGIEKLFQSGVISLPVLVFAGCLSLQICISPGECFLAYRHRVFSSNGLAVVRDWNLLMALGSSGGAALLAALIAAVTNRPLPDERAVRIADAGIELDETAAVQIACPASDEIAPASRRVA